MAGFTTASEGDLPMRLWIARHGDLSIREQLVGQLLLSILSGDLRAGQRLPSTRDLARRLRLHANTVSAVYRELEQAGWVTSRHGSGVYVRHHDRERLAPDVALDRLIADFFRTAREQGASLAQVRERLRRWLALQPPDHFLVIEPDRELQRILVAEIEASVGFRAVGVTPDDCRRREALAGAIPVVLLSKLEATRACLPPSAECIALHVRSVPGTLAAWLPIPPDALIVVASRWQDFLRWARTILVAAGAHPDAVECRDARRSDWQKGLAHVRVVITDILTARTTPPGCRTIAFPVIADDSLEALREYARLAMPAVGRSGAWDT